MFLHIEQLTKSYGAKRVVSAVDLMMAEGEVVSLLGPSGCGKTTLLRMIAGLVTPDSGWIAIGGRVVYDGRRAVPVEERMLGMVFQDFALWPHMTVKQNIAFGLRLRHLPTLTVEKRVNELLDLVNLPGLGNRYPYQLSGGQQQRVAVARALATQPRLLLLDEPLSNLDAGLRERMRTELVQLFKRLGITVIHVTHDRDEAMAVSDRILVLRDGQVQQMGTPAELYMEPANAFVASFMGAANLLPGTLECMAGAAGGMIRLALLRPAGCSLAGVIQKRAGERLPGQAVLICRPEAIQLLQQPPPIDQLNVLPGKVLHTAFIGGRWHTLVSICADPSVSIQAVADSRPQTGQPVWLHLPPSSCQIVPE